MHLSEVGGGGEVGVKVLLLLQRKPRRAARSRNFADDRISPTEQEQEQPCIAAQREKQGKGKET